jgi:hypothetical protein
MENKYLLKTGKAKPDPYYGKRERISCVWTHPQALSQNFTNRQQAQSNFLHAINIGSVENEDGIRRYVIPTILENISAQESPSIDVEFIRFKYDLEKQLCIVDSVLPDAYADMLRRRVQTTPPIITTT